jgi:peptide/nickel transport system substrate-binding protein
MQIEADGRGTGLPRRQFLARSLGSVATVGTLGALLEACGSGSSTTGTGAAVGKPPAVPTGTLTVALPGAPTSLDPGRRLGIGAFWATEDIYDSLVTFNPDYSQVVGQLCESWTVSPDAREWIGKVRQGVTFHDGTPLNSTAIRRNFEYFLKNAAYLFIPLPIKRIDDSKPDTIRFVFESPYPYFTRNVTLLKIQSPQAIAAGPRAIDRHPIGSGPLQFVSQSTNAITLERFPDYWSKGKPHVERVKFQIIPDAAARIGALRSGQVNVAPGLTPNDQVQLKSDPRTKVVSRPSWFVTMLKFKLTAPEVSDLRVRQAVAHAIDREAILSSIGRGQGTIADSFMPPGTEGYSPMSPSYGYDPEKARALLAEIGKPVNLHMYVLAGDALANFLAGEAGIQAIVGQLKDVGINATGDAITEAEAQKERAEPKPPHPAELSGYTWFTGGPIIYRFMEPDHNMEQAHPAEFARYQKLSDQMNAEADLAERERIIAEIQRIHAELLTHIPLFVVPVADGVSKDVQGHIPDIRNFGPNLDGVYFSS